MCAAGTAAIGTIRHRISALAIGLLVAWLLGACAVRTLSMPAYRMPTPEEIRAQQAAALEKMNQARGRSEPVTRRSADGVQIVLPDGHTSGINAVAMSPDGRYIASADYSGAVKLWDVASGKEIRTFIAETAALGLKFSPDGSRILMGTPSLTEVYDTLSGRQLTRQPLASYDGIIGVTQDLARVSQSLQITDIATGRTTSVLNTFGERPVAVSTGGAMLLTWGVGRKLFGANLDGDYIVWDLKSRQQIDRIPAAATIGEPVLDRDGRWVLVENRDGSIDACDPRGGPKHRVAGPDAGKPTLNVSFTVSEDGNRLARSTNAGAIEVYELPGGERVTALAAGDRRPWAPGSLLLSPDGQWLARRDQVDGFLVWDLRSGKSVQIAKAASLAFAANGRAVVGGSSGGAPVIHDLLAGSRTALASGAAGVPDVDVTADGRHAVAGSYVGGAKLWDLGTGQIVRTFDCPGGAPAAAVSIDRRAPLVAIGCTDGSVWLWDLKAVGAPRPVNPPAGGFGSLMRVRFSDDGRRIVVAEGETLSVWDVQPLTKVREIVLPRDSASPIPAGGPFGGLEALDPKAQKELMRRLPQRQRDALESVQANSAQANLALDPHTRELVLNASYQVQALAVQPGGHLAAVGREYQLSLWNLDSGERVRNLTAVPPTGGAPGQMGSLLGKSSAGAASRVITLTDPSQLSELLEDAHPGARSLAFSQDGSVLFADAARWDVATGMRLARPRSAGTALDPADMMRGAIAETGLSAALAVSPDRRLTARGVGRVVRLSDATTGEDVGDLVGHTGDVQSVAFSGDARFLLSGAQDGSVRIWRMADRSEVAALFCLGESDFVTVTPDQYYRGSKARLQGVSFLVKNQVYPFEQFDLRFNRPDVVLERLGQLPPESIASYRAAYERRLKKSGFTAAMLSGDFHVPEIAIVGGAPPLSTDADTLTLRVRSTDDRYPLDRLNAFVNDVPVFGTAGLSIREPATHTDERDVQLPLVPGRNKIQVSVLNGQGAESLRQTVYTTSTGAVPPPDVYLVAIGVSEYQNRRYDLRFAAKDAADVMNTYRSIESRAGPHGQVHMLDLTNSRATRAGIRQARDWLKQARSNDLVVVFAAGHGMTDPQRNYYFGTYDIDPAEPQVNGLPYEEFEGMLDGIRALKKVLLLDTCFSGEIEKDEPVTVAQADDRAEGTVSMRAFKDLRGITVTPDSVAGSLLGATPGYGMAAGSRPESQTGAQTGPVATPPGLDPDVVRFQQELFADLRRGTGAVVISSASGNEYALEGERWSNGVFTYALLSGLRDGKADANHDGTVSVSELQAYVIDEVRRLTAGGQNPTVRRENLDYDFELY